MDARESSLWTTIRRHIGLAATTALLIGIVDGFVSARGGQHGVVVGALFGGGLLALVGALVGLIQGPVMYFTGGLLEKSGLLARWQAMNTADPSADRDPVIDFHAWITTVIVVGGVVVGGFALFMGASTAIKEPSLRNAVLIMAVAIAVGTMALAAGLNQSFARALMRRVDAKLGLPVPKSSALRYLIFIALPMGGVLIPMHAIYGVKLGLMSPLFGACLFFVAQGLVWKIHCAAAPRFLTAPRRRRVGTTALILTLLAAMGWSVTAFGTWRSAAAVAADGQVLPSAVEILQSLTDVDGDGISGLFGGQDCAPFDGSRSPSAREIAGNGIDEDCDGGDADAREALPKLATYFDQLTPKQKKRYNVLFLVIDSLRSDHVSGNGYRKKTTPHLDELGKTAWVFTRAYSQSSTTALSMPSMHTGRRPSSMQWKSGYPQPIHPERMMPAVMSKMGYRTTLAVNQYVKRFLKGLQRGFQEVLTVPKGTDWRSGEYIISDIISAVNAAKQAKQPFFITAHFDDVHHPYRAFTGRSVPTFPHKNRDISYYDRCIANMDNMLRPLFSHLRHTGVWDDTILIITSDHGEEFGEHGETIHSRSCYTESVHVPLIVKIPGFAPARIDERVSLIDLAPTLAEVLDVPRDGLQFDGQSLFVPALAPELVSKERPIFCAIFQLLRGRKNFFTRSVRTADHTLVHEAYSDTVELFDNHDDPGEKRNIATQNKAAVDALQPMLKAALTGNLWEARRFK